jgi:hypothetical protein
MGAKPQVSALSVWPCLLCGNPLLLRAAVRATADAGFGKRLRAYGSLGGVERLRRVVCFARLIQAASRGVVEMRASS